jgi:hypothetical protein
MKNLPTILSLAALSLSALAGAAQAQPSVSASADGEVSTLNDQLVPVGEQNRYEHSYKRFNVSTDPLGIIYGAYGVSLSYALNERIAVRGDVDYVNPVDSDQHGVHMAFGAPIYFRKMYSGLFLEPGVGFSRITDDSRDKTTTKVGPQVLVGYHWYWDSGLNVALAAGIGRNLNASDSDSNPESADGESTGDSSEIVPAGYLRFGYAF